METFSGFGIDLQGTEIVPVTEIVPDIRVSGRRFNKNKRGLVFFMRHNFMASVFFIIKKQG
jgi:hypothetical protein